MMDIKLEESNQHEVDSISFQETKKMDTILKDNEKSDEVPVNNSTNNINLPLKNEVNENTERQEEYINLLSTKSELESEVTNLSSTLDSRDDENEKECESSLDLSYKNKSLPNSVENSSDNSENVLEFDIKIVPPDEKLSESSSITDKHLFKTKINGSNPIIENNETKGESEDSINIEKNSVDSKKNLMLSEDSCSSSSSSVALVIDQQPEFTSANTVASHVTERDKDKFEENNSDFTKGSKNIQEEKLEEKTINECETSKSNINMEKCSNNSKNMESDNLNIENLCKLNSLKRKISFCKEIDSSYDNCIDNDKCQSPKHKILHLDEKYVNDRVLVKLDDNIQMPTLVSTSESSNNQDENMKKIQPSDNKLSSEAEIQGIKNVDLGVEISNPILRNQLVLKTLDNDPGGIFQQNLNNSSDRVAENQMDSTGNTRAVEQTQNDNKNYRFNVQLSNFGNNYLYGKSDKLIPLNFLPETVAGPCQENLVEPFKVIKSEEYSEEKNDVKDFSKPNMTDFSNNLILNNLELNAQVNNLDNTNAQEKSKTMLEISSNVNPNNFCEKPSATNNALIDLTDDTIEPPPATLVLAPKEKILQDWNKTNSLPVSTNQTQNSQDLFKQSSSDIRRLENKTFNNQLEPALGNRLDTVTNYSNNLKLLNNQSLKFSIKYGKQSKNIEKMSNKSMKKSKNLYQNNKGFRQRNLTKKIKEYPISSPSTNYHSGSIIQSSQYSLPNKLSPPVIPPVYELSHTLNRHTEYKCSKCLNSNFKNIRELENHHKYCLYNSSNESIFLNSNQHQQLGLSSINNIKNNNITNNNRLSQFPTGINNLIHEDVLNIPKEANITNFRNLNKQQPPLFNINDKPIEITPNLNHYLNQVEQKHKNLLQHHHLNHSQNIFSHSLDETIKRTFLQSDSRQQSIVSVNDQKLSTDGLNSRYGGLLSAGFQTKKKLHNFQQQQLQASFLDNGNILDYPIIQDSSNIFEINDSLLNFNNSGLQKCGNVGVIKDLRRFSSSGVYGSNIDLSSNALSVLGKPQIENSSFSSSLQQKTDSLEPIMVKVKQNQFSPILPPDQLLNKLSTSNSLSTSLSSASSSFQEPSTLNTSLPEVVENHLSSENIKRKVISLDNQHNDENQLHAKSIEKEIKRKTSTQHVTNLNEKTQQISSDSNNENFKSNSASVETKNNKKTKKLFLCSSCGSYHENWNLFLHMREMHKRHICLLCLRMFPTAEQLTVHLEMRHDIEQNHFESQEKLIRSSRDSCYLMCCTCEHIFTEHDDFYQHICANYLTPCFLCGLLGKHALNCKYATSDHKRSKRHRKFISTKKSQQNHQNVLNINETKMDLLTPNDITKVIQETTVNESLTLVDEEQHQLAQYNNCVANNKNSNQHTEHQSKSNVASISTTATNDENNSDSNNGSDSDSNNKYNGYLEHFNYNDNDLINLYKSNRLANLAKQKEKEEAEAKDKYSENQNQEICENQLLITIQEDKIPLSNIDGKSNKETVEKISMPKLTLKISKEMFNRAQHLGDDSEEQSSTESTDAEDNENQNEEELVKLDNQRQVFDLPKENSENSLANISSSSCKVIENESEINVVKDQNMQKENLINQNLENTIINSQINDLEANRENNENKIQTVLDENKSDSDMDIDVTCNQGGDVAPIATLSLQNQSQISDNPIQSHESSADTIQVEDNVSKMDLPEIPINNNENITEVNDQSQLDTETTKGSAEFDLLNKSDTNPETNENKSSSPTTESSVTPIKKIPTDGIELANEDVQISELNLDAPLDKIPMVTLLRIMLKKTFPICLYCNHARRIAVNGNSLALHMLSSHRFSATVDSITAEELLPGTIISKLKNYLNDLNEYYFNMETYCNTDKSLDTVCPTIDEKVFECFSCRFSTRIHKELYLHNRKMHLRTAILCFMCRSNFYSYSEILCHICPGAQYKVVLFDIKFRCCICDLDQIPSAFRLMVHLRKAHFACDVCLENCYDQSRLSSHVWKHKLHHLCYRCGIAYRNKPDITKHLFWKHGTESVLCKRCLQKRWPHVYHFCIPPTSFVCEICNLAFTRAMYLKVHKRLHSGDAPYPCTEDNCDKKFISRKLLLKHVEDHEKLQNEEKLINVSEPDKTIKEENNITDIKPENLPKPKEEESVEGTTGDKEKCKETDGHLNKKRKKKIKRSSETKETLEDLNLQAPNLSESGSSDDSDSEAPIKQNSLVPNVMLSPPSEQEEQEEEEEGKKEASPEKIIDIWNNFKTFQAAHNKMEDSGIEDNNIEPPTPILHVVQSDHDYCRMHKVVNEKINAINMENKADKHKLPKDENNKANILQNGDKNNRSLLLPISPSKRKQKSTKKSHAKSGSESSSSDEGSSSSSDSSCTCGSNCSCSSTTDSSSDSSSSSDTDSSTSEGKKRIAAKRAAKEERRRNRLQSENSSKANNSDVVDVVTTDLKPEPKLLEPVIYEDDLETDESDTDEDFYDEHPQKLASEILAEKRRQLMKQTCLSPSHNFDIVENSRPSTPSLPEDVYGTINNREKKVKVKKKKRERKTSNKNLVPPFKLNISKTNIDGIINKTQFIQPINPTQSNKEAGPIISGNKVDSFISLGGAETSVVSNTITPIITENQDSEISLYQTCITPTTATTIAYQNLVNSNVISTSFSELTSTQSQDVTSQNYQPLAVGSAILNSAIARPSIHLGSSAFSAILPAPIDPTLIRHSTESSSDASANLLSNADTTLKRSKRARRPNRFYGYSSDDETTHNASLLGPSGVFKPIPPPNLTWRKEDLPTPPRNSSSKNIKPSGLKTSLLSGSKKIKLFSKKKDNSIKKEKQLSSKLIKSGNSSDMTIPRIPTLKIKPMDILPQIPPSILDHQSVVDTSSYQRILQPPPVVEPINSIPPVPVHHIDPPQFYPSSKESIDSDSESDEDKLTIPLQIFNTESKSVTHAKTGKKSAPKTSKSNNAKANKSKGKNSGVTRTSYNTIPSTQIANFASLNMPLDIKEQTPPPPPKEKKIPPALLPNPDLATLQYFKRNNIRYPIRPPAGARAPREGESVYCYCRCPYDEVSEMIACDGDDCMIEWFHFECVGILVAPQGKWFCAECKPNQQIYSSPQNTSLQTQQYQNQTITDQNLSAYGNSSLNISGFNGPLINNSNVGFSTNSGSMSY